MANKKVQIQLLDEVTGAFIEDVDVVTTADAVKFADGETFEQKLSAGKLTGPKGATGAQGAAGTNGAQGPKGDTGAQGAAGTTGAQGPKGDTGAQGATGSQGPKGADGTKMHNVTAAPATSLGAIGEWALNTTNGDVYEKTAAAVWTKRGNFKGATGAQGPKGDTGATGDKGATGAQGTQGLKGDTGGMGPQGPKGDTGAKGATGSQGPQGAKGDPGDVIKVGTTTTNAVPRKLFFKVVG